MPRIAPVTGKSVAPVHHHNVVDAVQKVFGNVRGPFSILLHSPALAERLLPLVLFFPERRAWSTRSSARSPSSRRCASAKPRTCGRRRSAQRAATGLREDVIDVLRAKGDPTKLSEEERDIVTYVRQLMRTNRVDQAAFDRLKKRHDAQWMVELTEAANYFAFLSGVVNAFEVPAPPEGDKLPS